MCSKRAGPPQPGHRASRAAINAHVTIRTKEPGVPEEFPPARLFLDDIEEIVRILREFIESRETGSHSSVEDLKIKVRFSTGGKECDDIQDLPKIAKSNRELSIEVARGRWVEAYLRCHPWLGTLWWSMGHSQEDKWSAFRKVQPVFQKRSRRWSTLLHSLPWWLVLPLWTAPIGAVLLLMPLLYNLMSHRAAHTIQALMEGIIFTVMVIGARHTTLTLRNSWDPSPLRQYMKDKLIPVIAGTLLGIAGTALTLYLRHKYWP
jgi:hypothetical protein